MTAKTNASFQVANLLDRREAAGAVWDLELSFFVPDKVFPVLTFGRPNGIGGTSEALPSSSLRSFGVSSNNRPFLVKRLVVYLYFASLRSPIRSGVDLIYFF